MLLKIRYKNKEYKANIGLNRPYTVLSKFAQIQPIKADFNNQPNKKPYNNPL